MEKKIQKKFFFSEIIAYELIAWKLSLLRTEWLSSAVNVLTNSLKVLHIINRFYLCLNCLHNDR